MRCTHISPRAFQLGAALFLLSSVCIAPVQAQSAPVSPIKLEKLLTGVGSFRLDSSLTYANGSISLNPFGTGPGQVQPVLSNPSLDTDSIAATLGLSYGLAKGLQLSLSTSGTSETSALPTAPDLGRNTTNSWSGLNMGLSYSLLNNSPSKVSLVGFFGVDLLREVKLPGNGGKKKFSARSGSFGLSLNRVIDPVVLSATLAYQKNVSGSINGARVKLPDSWSFSPGVNFQVNERIGLGWGVQVSHFQKYKINQEVLSGTQTVTAFNFSTSYQLEKDSALNMAFSFPAGRDGASSLSLRLIHDF